jgi:hypothetical protein
MFVNSKLFLAGLCALFLTTSANAQSVSVKLGNKFGAPLMIKSIDVKCDDWTCKPPTINGMFGLHDSLELTFDPISNVAGTAVVKFITEQGVLEHRVELAPRATADINAAIQPGLFVSPVWPNPAKENLSFNLNGLGSRTINAYIYDLQGKEIFTRPVDRDGAITLNLPSMPEGRYYFMLRDGMETITLQEIKVTN